jgi:hypothetical protein
MSTLSTVETVWVVLDAEGRVVIICTGADAPVTVEEWRDRGYRVAQLDAVSVSSV